MSARFYPTGNALIGELTEFAANRLPSLHKPDMTRKPSLREEWWLEETGNLPCPVKQGWAWFYRFARDAAVDRSGSSDGAADLLAHQLRILLPILFARMLSIPHEQAVAAEKLAAKRAPQ